jgi:hypothetical protein
LTAFSSSRPLSIAIPFLEMVGCCSPRRTAG